MASSLFPRSVWYWERTNPPPSPAEIPLGTKSAAAEEEEEGIGGGEGDGDGDGDGGEEEEEGEEGKGGGRRRSEGKGSVSQVPRMGVVVALGWMFSRRKNLAPYSRLYRSLGWDCLLCHPQVVNLFFAHPATTLALSILDELAKDLENDPCPVVFAIFSGGHKACFYKIIQILQGKCKDVAIDEGRYDVVMRCLVGVIFDSSPVNFLGELGARFVSHQVLTLEPGKPFAFISWAASAVGKGVDCIFSSQLEPQREELWRALYSIVGIGPILFFCCENDELSPIETIKIFAANLLKLGGRVDLNVWKESEHVGHFRLFPELYSSKVKKLLAEASFLYIERLQKSAQLESNGHGINALLGISTPNAWTELAESIAKEIEQVAKLPHIKSKESSICCEKEDSTGKYSISSLATSTCSGSSNRENMIRSRL